MFSVNFQEKKNVCSLLVDMELTARLRVIHILSLIQKQIPGEERRDKSRREKSRKLTKHSLRFCFCSLLLSSLFSFPSFGSTDVSCTKVDPSPFPSSMFCLARKSHVLSITRQLKDCHGIRCRWTNNSQVSRRLEARDLWKPAAFSFGVNTH